MPPKFTLQTVLDVRHNRVEALEIELGKLLALLSTQENMALHLVERRSDVYRRLENAMGGEMDLFAGQCLRDEAEQVTEQIDALRAKIEECNRRIACKRQEIVTARQAEEVLEILKEKEQARFDHEQNRRDASIQDDLYIAQAFRRQEARTA